MVCGLDRAGFRRQMKRIDRLNGRLRTLTVLKGAEVDILPDGSLDLDDETLAELDLVVALGRRSGAKRVGDQAQRRQHPPPCPLAQAAPRRPAVAGDACGRPPRPSRQTETTR
jgi:hypothetical protein